MTTLTKKNLIENIYPLTPMQQGILFHSLYTPNSVAYFMQLGCTLHGNLNVASFQKAWQAVQRRHSILRTAIVLKRQNEPFQVVYRECNLPWTFYDWRELPVDAQQERLSTLLQEQRKQGFRFDKAPIMSLTLIQLGEDHYHFIWNHHHVLMDGWSASLLLQEVFAFYKSLNQGIELKIAQARSYGDYVQWILQQDAARVEAYWQQALKGFTSPTQLTSKDSAASNWLSHEEDYGVQEMQLSAEATYALQELAQQHSCTLNTLVQGIWGLLLSRYSGENDVVFGSIVSGRSADIPGIESMIGLFFNTLPVRMKVQPAETVLSWLKHVQEQLVEMRQFEYSPLAQIQGWSEIPRGTPLFEHVLVFENYPLDAALHEKLDDIKIDQIHSFARTNYPFVMLIVPQKELYFKVTYDSQRFSTTMIQGLLQHLCTLLQSLPEQANSPLWQFSLLTPAERQHILHTWNQTAQDYDLRLNIPERFALQVARTPDYVALIAPHQQRQLTYRQLDQQSNQLAHSLLHLGVGPEARVGICLERSLELLVAVYAVLKAGAAYVPLDPDYPQERLRFMLEDAQVCCLLTQQSLRQHLTLDPSIPTLCLDTQWEHVAHMPQHAPHTHSLPEQIAYVIYTSGSTGRPKGVMNTHRALSNRLLWMQEAYGLHFGERVLHKTPISFDVSVWELFWPLLFGATLVLAQPGGHRDSQYLSALIEEQQISTLHFVPSMLQMFLQQPEARQRQQCHSLKRVICSGEALPQELSRACQSQLGVKVYNLYGPTEAAIDVTAWESAPESETVTVPIGRPIANVQIYLLDEQLQPVPVGVLGELYIAGEGLARGYLQRSELTAEKFVPNPWDRGQRLYRTGDVARYLQDGAIEFVGRKDQQVKLRGLRIELEEIEEVLRSHPQVKECAVQVSKDQAGESRLVGYVVAQDQMPGHEELRRHLGKKLPDYMVPGVYVPLSALPLTPSGKLDRKSLPQPEGVRPDLQQAYVPPSTELEQFLTNLWQETLNIERIGIHDNFFDLGGDSIKAMMLVNKLQARLAETIHIAALFDAPAVSAMAQYLCAQYATAIERAFGLNSLVSRVDTGKQDTVIDTTTRVDANQIALMRQVITPLPPRQKRHTAGGKNPTAVFVLSAPRSGSTLLRVMLEGHSHLFAPPELELLSFNTLQERQTALSGRNSFAQEGLLRALMEILHCNADSAKKLIDVYTEQDMSTQDLYRIMQEKLSPRILVDKTPTYALDMEMLKRAEQDFKEPFYLHLVRHPLGMIRSFEEAHLNQVFFRYPHTFSVRELAELIWIVSQLNIQEFLRGIPSQRQYQLCFEDLVKQPETVLRELCAALHIDFQPEMVQVYKEKRMTDGTHSVSRMLGDVKFHQHRQIEASVADRWRDYRTDDLGTITCELAKTFGYELWPAVTRQQTIPDNEPVTTIQPLERHTGQHLPLSFSQQRLWFLDQLESGSPFYNIHNAVRVHGLLDLTILERSLNMVIQRHETLRTSFVAVNGQPFQVIAPSVTLALPFTDLRHLPPKEREKTVQHMATTEAKEPFDLSKGPLLRLKVLQVAREEFIILLTTHHIISDGWSMGNFLTELGDLYQSFAEQRDSQLPPLPIQYADFAQWQRQWLQGTVLERQVSYWKRQLGGQIPTLQLPTDYPRPTTQSFKGAKHEFTLPRQLSETLKQVSQREGVTMFMSLLAAFSVLLHRYSGQKDILIGTPIGGRNRLEVERLIGFFVNTLVLRTDLSGNPLFSELLQRVRKVALEAYAHQELPFEKLVEELKLERDLGYNPLFQVMFVWQNTPLPALQLPGITFSPVEADSETAILDLVVSMEETEQGLSGIIQYRTDLFKRDTIVHMVKHFQRVLESIASATELRLAELALMNEQEQHQVLVDWNKTTVAYSKVCIHQLFEEQARRSPEAIAVICDDQTLTYRELNQQANQQARYLHSLGVGPEVQVGIYMERCLDVVVSILGVLKAGGTYIPLDPEGAPERLELILQDAQVPLLLTQRALREQLPVTHARMIIEVDTSRAHIAAENSEDIPCSVSPSNAAYIIYTSGSTGIPRGVIVPHGALSNHCQAFIETHKLTPGDRVLQFISLCFDAAAESLFPFLASGGSLVMRSALKEMTPLELLAMCEQQAVTILHLPTLYLHKIIDELVIEQQSMPGGIRLCIAGGEALVTDKLLAYAPYTHRPLQIGHEYGPTETTITATLHTTDLDQLAHRERRARLPIGSPIANVQIYLLDEYAHPVPPGVPGEIYIGGAGIARGYLNQPGLTAEKFLPHPFQSGERLYRTGDMARYLPDGQIEFIGRTDFQIKLRGYRIELGEIESALQQYGALQDVAVMLREDIPEQKQLVAYIVPLPDRTLVTRDIRTFLQKKLPSYMVPPLFVTMQTLPRTGHGKVDLRALPVPEQAHGTEPDAVPQTTAEESLAQIWREVLGVEHVGLHDNFFEIGGDSILSIKIVARAKEKGLYLSPKQIFQYQTVAELAEVLQGQQALMADQGMVTGPVPLTPIEHWFFEDLELVERHHWNQTILLRATERLDPAALKEALTHLLAHHDALRLRFVQTETGWVQTNAPVEAGELPFHFIDHTHIRPDQQEQAREDSANTLQASLNLTTGPLLRVALFDAGPSTPQHLLLIAHHLVMDNVSGQILLDDLQTAYRQIVETKETRLPAKTTSFKRWAELLNHHAQSDDMRADLPYWSQLSTAHIPPLPRDYSHGDNTVTSSRTVSVELDAEKTRALLQDVPAAYRTQINDVLLTTLVRAYARWSDTRAILVDLEGHGREEIFETVDLSRTVGWFTTAYPLLLDIRGQSNHVGEEIKAVKEALGGVPQRGISYGVLRYLCPDTAVRQQLSRLPQAELSFNYLGQFHQGSSSPSLFEPASGSSGAHHSPLGMRRYVIEINCLIADSRLQVHWKYSEHLHHRTTIETLAKHFIDALHELITHCLTPSASSFTPSSFPALKLNQQQLDKVMAKLRTARKEGN